MRIGVDLGGTKIEVIVLDEAGRERLRRRVATPQDRYLETLEAVRDLVLDAEQELGTRCPVGIATPGALSKASGLLKNSNSTCLNGKPLKDDLESLLQRPLRIANDADCFALSEATDGGAAGASSVFGIILGTGVGGGIVVNGRLLTGPNGIAGEWGHNPLPWPKLDEYPGPECYCGRRGCIETFVSGPGLAHDHARRTGCPLEAKDIVQRAASGDAACAASIALYEERLARALAHVINLLDPEVIVLGGGLSNCERLYRNLPTHLAALVFSDRVDTRIVPPRFGDSSGVRGAAWLWESSPLSR
ncbi:ROK family protein [Methyloterricola oryzae]|uniref:ROK family protein n=1 Tax=Methyloterricola oryzae TaxID=1495050 RepID=UPI0005EB3308|nr:ROK family protein [Methyloterricola oryzae]